ncbi:MAG: PilZ domain-containing protein [Acidobacteria bacterium]|nr:PilZ domain-containing protein [Acidobacteriota bacterium]
MPPRRQSRVPIGGKLQLVWTDEQGQSYVHRGTCVDASETGMRIELKERIPVGTRVSFQAGAADIHGSGSVRNCVPHKLNYYVGIEFTGGLKWKLEADG